MKPDRHCEHKQHAFDSYCKKVLKYEAYNGYREISRRQKCEAQFSELSEQELAQLAVYDRYSWEYTAACAQFAYAWKLVPNGKTHTGKRYE